MNTQIAVRLRDDVAAYLDRAVAEGREPSRAALVTRAVERQMRADAARIDAAILTETGADDDLDDLVAWSSQHLPDLG